MPAELGQVLAAAGGSVKGMPHCRAAPLALTLQRREQGLPSLFYRCARKQRSDRLLGLSSQACALQMCQ